MILSELQRICEDRLTTLAQHYLQNQQASAPQLYKAMNYSVSLGGKRIRPLLTYATGQLFDTPFEILDAPAFAIELIHTYSLIHDDLPAMDDSALRRGKPSCHIAFGETLAILAGDALQPLAFEILSSHPCSLSSTQRIKMIQLLAKASGASGMAAGQVLDIQGVSTLNELEYMYQLKTGELLSASMHLGTIASNIEDPNILNSLTHFIQKIGLAFQIQDDLLDIEGNAALTGKPQGQDHFHQKITYPSIIGVPQAKQLVKNLFDKALVSLKNISLNTTLLQEIAYLLIKRNY